MGAYVNVNGVVSDAAHAVISVFDHGFLFGEGVYEVYRTYNGEPFLFSRHLDRLRASADRIGLDVPFTDELILERSVATARAAGLGRDAGGAAREAYVRIMVTRGIGEVTYDPAATPTPSLIIIAKPLPVTPEAHYTAGTKVVMVDLIRNHPRSVNPRIKSNNLLNNALGMQQALRNGGVEGVFRNYRGELSECAQSNLFIVSRGVVLTPPLEAGLLAGITRAFVMEISAGVGVRTEERPLRDQDLLEADEAFFTSTTKELVPIVQVDDRTIGAAVPGPVTLRLLAEYRRQAEAQTALSAQLSAAKGTR